jgi:hypothetical protein
MRFAGNSPRHNLPRTIYRAQFIAHNSSRTIHRAQFTVYNSPPAQFIAGTIHRRHNSSPAQFIAGTIRRSKIHRVLFTTKK